MPVIFMSKGSCWKRKRLLEGQALLIRAVAHKPDMNNKEIIIGPGTAPPDSKEQLNTAIKSGRIASVENMFSSIFRFQRRSLFIWVEV